jgi:hypothetical protein
MLSGVRRAAVAGVAYVTLFAASLALTAKGPCGGVCFARTSDTVVASFYEDSGNRWRIGIAFVLFGLALFLFLWFLARLGTGFVLLAGGVYATLEAAGLAVYTAVATGRGMTVEQTHYNINADVLRAAGDISWTLRSLGSVAAAALVFATAVALRPRRLAIVGYVLGAATLIFALQEGMVDRGLPISFGVQDIAFLIWILVLSFAFLRTPEPGP